MGQSLAFPTVRPEGLDTSLRLRYASGVAFTKVLRASGFPLLVTSPRDPLRVSFLCPTSYTPTVALPTTALSPVTPVPDRRFRAPLCPSLGSPSSTPLHASPSHLACITGWYPLARPIASLADLLEISTLQPSLGAPHFPAETPAQRLQPSGAGGSLVRRTPPGAGSLLARRPAVLSTTRESRGQPARSQQHQFRLPPPQGENPLRAFTEARAAGGHCLT